MKEFYLQELLKIFGIEAASGIEYTKDRIYIISDNSNYLYDFQINNGQLTKHALLERFPMEQIIKSEKMDLEAIVDTGDMIYAFGSGSTAVRELGFSFSKKDQKIKTIELSKLYGAMRESVNLDHADFNIEAVAQDGNNWLFLNRGNGPAGRNVIFDVKAVNLTDDFQISCYEIALPQRDNLHFGFSGASVIDDRLFFIATAEEGKSTYEDGKIGGTQFGIIDLKTMKIEFNLIISHSHKFEGITLYKEQTNMISFLLCEDNDGTNHTASIFKLDIL